MATQDAQNRELATAKNGGDGTRQQDDSGLARWSPFTLLDEIQDEFARWWGRPLQRPSQLLAQLPMGVPRLDMYEDNGNIVVKAEVPGSFYHRVPLGFDVDPEKVQAELRDGVLELRIPKPAEAKSTTRQIPVRS